MRTWMLRREKTLWLKVQIKCWGKFKRKTAKVVFWNLVVFFTFWYFTEKYFEMNVSAVGCFEPKWAAFDMQAVWPDLAIYWTLGNFLMPLAPINLPKSPSFLGNLCKGVKIYHFSSGNHFGATFIDIWRFFWSHCSWVTFTRQCKCQEIAFRRRKNFAAGWCAICLKRITVILLPFISPY